MKLDLLIECGVCGDELEVDQRGDRLCVSPCSDCQLEEYSNGQDEGYEAGFKDGRDIGEV
jgi:hypothetical protein